MSDYTGVGYNGINTVGDPSTGDFKIQDYLVGFSGNTTDYGLTDVLKDEVQAWLEASNFQNTSNMVNLIGSNVTYEKVIAQYFTDNGFPTNLSDFITGFRKSIDTVTRQVMAQFNLNPSQIQVPQNSPYYTDAKTNLSTGADSWNILLANYEAVNPLAHQLVYNSQNQLVPYDSLTVQERAVFTDKLLNGAFTDYATDKFVYQYPDLTQTVVTGADKAEQFMVGFANYNKVISGITDTNLSITLEKFYKAFFDTATTQDFQTFYANFVYKQFGNPIAENGAVAGDGTIFSPTLLFDSWTKEVINAYTINNPNSFGPNNSTTADSSKKTAVLNRIFNLLVLMITSLQKVTAAQSNRLGVLTKWQGAYTALQNEIKFAIKDGLGFNQNFSSNETIVERFNSQNSTYTEAIKARKDVVGDDAKNLQTQINQSNDGVNQQSSLATSILQQLNTIFSAIYR